jgi:transcriptional regulator with XRE-family HTH domain
VDRAKRKALEAAGYWIGDAEDFLELSDEERRLVQTRLKLSRLARDLRIGRRLTQQQLATRMKSSQSRVAKVEAAAADVSLDQMFRNVFAAGGELFHVAAALGGGTTKGRGGAKRSQPKDSARHRLVPSANTRKVKPAARAAKTEKGTGLKDSGRGQRLG